MISLLLLLAAAPTSYTITQTVSLFGPAVQSTVKRNGSKAMLENPDVVSFYDLDSGRTWTWNPKTPGAQDCSIGSFTGDWGDPFAFSASISSDLAKDPAKELGKSTVNGIAVTGVEQSSPTGSAKIWRDANGLVVKLEMSAEGTTKTMIEVTRYDLKPPRLELPAACAALKPPPTDAEKVAELTGGRQGYSFATNPPSTPSPCAVEFKLVAPKTLAPIDGGWTFKPSADLSAAPEQFNVEIVFPDGGGSALVYRRCRGPRGKLLFVVHDAGKISGGGDWIWAP